MLIKPPDNRGDIARLSHMLVPFRQRFLSSASDRQRIVEWLDSLTDFTPFGGDTNLCVRSIERSNKEEEDWHSCLVPVSVLKRAVAAWDKGDDYIPSYDDLHDLSGVCFTMKESI